MGKCRQADALRAIAFDEAIPVAILGLFVNVASAWLLRDDHKHDWAEHLGAGSEDREHRHFARNETDSAVALSHAHDRDLNFRAAYVHVLADAAVSVLAIIGLVCGRQLGWIWLDPVMGILGAAVIANWSWGLIRSAGAVLLDLKLDVNVETEVLKRLEQNGDRVADLHLWRVGPDMRPLSFRLCQTDRNTLRTTRRDLPIYLD